MIKNKTTGSLIVISGISGAGKDSIVKNILSQDNNVSLVTSYTSRSIRPKEVEGKDYYFVTREEFERKIANGDFLEYAKVHYGEYYGTPKKEMNDMLEQGKDVILVIDVEGAKQVKELYPTVILIFILPPSMREVKRRLMARNTENVEQLIDRFKTSYREINEVNKYNYVVVNDVLDFATEKVKAIIKAEKCRVDRIEEIKVENEEEIIHELLMDKEFINEDFRV